MGECWGEGTATVFMILEISAPVPVAFCCVLKRQTKKRSIGKNLKKLVRLYKNNGHSKHAVITSVDRKDDIKNGSIIWAETGERHPDE